MSGCSRKAIGLEPRRRQEPGDPRRDVVVCSTSSCSRSRGQSPPVLLGTMRCVGAPMAMPPSSVAGFPLQLTPPFCFSIAQAKSVRAGVQGGCRPGALNPELFAVACIMHDAGGTSQTCGLLEGSRGVCDPTQFREPSTIVQVPSSHIRISG